MILDFITTIRKNHALEHATVSVLMRKLRPGARLMGRSTADGFYIYGDAPHEAVSEAAEEALGRLKQGEGNLAVSPFCGTNLAVAAILAGLASMLAMRGEKEANRLPNVLLATLAAVVIAQPIGRIAQKYLTTSADVADVDIAEVTSTRKGTHTRHKIRTLRG
ncbi:MAG TPA: hypothetical protein G4O13_04115 [Dehalococcoidia bacterium]|nr:hypothetical protein [Dehalococcoidia bacterium]